MTDLNSNALGTADTINKSGCTVVGSDFKCITGNARYGFDSAGVCAGSLVMGIR